MRVSHDSCNNASAGTRAIASSTVFHEVDAKGRVSQRRFGQRVSDDHAHTRCKRFGWRFEAAQTGADPGIHPPMTCSFPFPSTLPRCCPIDRCRRKYDPSRAGGGSVPGRPVGGPGDRAVLPDFAGVAAWRAASVRVSSGLGTHPRSRPAPDSSSRRCKTSPRNPTLDKTTAATPLLEPSHPSRV